MNTTQSLLCPACHQSALVEETYVREFFPGGKEVLVELVASRCVACAGEFTTSRQHDENLARLSARKKEYGDFLLGEEISALRRKYGITQQQAGKIFGKGKIAFSRYETESSYPDLSTTKLLKLSIAKPDVMKWLADSAAINLPLWANRCANERASKEIRLVLSEHRGGATWKINRVGPQHEIASQWVKHRGPIAECDVSIFADNDDDLQLAEATAS